MQLEKQVCSLELAKKLCELGVKQESEVMWAIDESIGRKEPIVIEINFAEHCNKYNNTEYETVACAFTVAELGEMLPAGTNYRKNKGSWFAIRAVNEDTHFERADTEADARSRNVHLPDWA